MIVETNGVEENIAERMVGNMRKGVGAVVALLIGAGIGAALTGKLSHKSVDKKEGKIDKFKSYYNMLNQWLALKQEGKSLVGYFMQNNINSIAIYGMGEMGNRLYDELKESEIEIRYAVDKNAENTYSKLNVKSLEDDLPSVDAIIVTAVFAFSEIEKTLSSKVGYQVISLEDVVYES